MKKSLLRKKDFRRKNKGGTIEARQRNKIEADKEEKERKKEKKIRRGKKGKNKEKKKNSGRTKKRKEEMKRLIKGREIGKMKR